MIVFNRSAGRCRFLLVLSRLTKRPLWEFPKGGVDEGETLMQTALRELREETGIAADAVEIVPGFEWRESYRFTSGRETERTLIQKQVTYFLAETSVVEITLAASELSEYAWLDIDEATRRIKYPERRKMLKDAAALIGCAGAQGTVADAPGNAR
jgi:bis(5'-nucleosidyl)-tetraphosphatase